MFYISQKKPKKKRKQENRSPIMTLCNNCNLYFPETQRHNCQRGMRKREKDQITCRYNRMGKRTDIRNRKYNRRATQ